MQTRSTGRRATIRYTDPNQEFVDNWPAPPRLLVGGGRLVWISTRSVSANSYPTGHLLEASVSATRGRRLRNVGFGLDGSGDHFVGIGGGVDGKFVYGITRVFTPPSDPGSEYKVSGGEVTLLENGRKRTLPGAPPPALVARHGEHVAVSPADRDFYGPTKPGQTFIRPTPALEIRSATTGAVTSSVTATRPPRALTQSNTLTAVLTATTIEWYDAASGDRRGLVPAPKNVVDGAPVRRALPRLSRPADGLGARHDNPSPRHRRYDEARLAAAGSRNLRTLRRLGGVVPEERRR